MKLSPLALLLVLAPNFAHAFSFEPLLVSNGGQPDQRCPMHAVGEPALGARENLTVIRKLYLRPDGLQDDLLFVEVETDGHRKVQPLTRWPVSQDLWRLSTDGVNADDGEITGKLFYFVKPKSSESIVLQFKGANGLNQSYLAVCPR